MRHGALLSIMSAAAMLIPACGRKSSSEVVSSAGGDPKKGKAAIEHYGCAGCHTIAGIQKAVGLVGPSLNQVALRNYIGGVANNTPENMVRWIQNPQAISPRTAMPNLHVTEADARDIVSYLYTLR